MASKRSAAAKAESNNDAAVEAALALIDAELNGDASIADAVSAITVSDGDVTVEIELAGENGESAPAAGASEEAMEGQTEEAEVVPDEGDIEAAIAQVEAEAEADAAAAANAKATKKSGSKKAAAPKAAPVPTRAFTDVASIDKATLDGNIAAINAKKVVEKAQNVIQAVETGKKLSRYTADAVKALKQNGRVSAKSLVETFQAAGLKDGTARAQSQQMTALFKALGIAMPDAANARELVIADSGLVDELVQLAA